MKNAGLTVLALASTIGEVAATFGFRGVGSFTCPGNIENKCDKKQFDGYDWGDLNIGGFSNYHGMGFNGWECKQSFGKRDHLTKRTFGNKCISGVAKPNKDDCPNFGVGTGADFDFFSIDEFDIDVEFDVDLEFHYTLEDGSNCKHRSSCKKGGSTIQNTQCGGAKKVHVILPPSKGKSKCNVGIHRVKFNCNKPPKPRPTSSKVESTTTTAAPTTVSTVSTEKTTTTTAKTEETTTSTTVKTEETTSTVVVPTTTTTEILTTSTIFTTTVSTITDCGPTVTCPGGTKVTTLTVSLSTTVCPVTLTTTSTNAPNPTTSKTDEPKPTTTPTTLVPTTLIPTTITSNKPEPTSDCPTVVPKCLNTFLFALTCKDNTDTACFCPDKVFIENVFTCFYAHGETDVIISQAVIFLQGICRKHIPENPCIATGAETITNIITVTAPPPPAVYTTVTFSSAVLTVPDVDFTTTAGTVGLVQPTGGVVITPLPAPTTTLRPIVGTGGFTPTQSAGQVVVTAAAGRVHAAAGMLGFAAMAAVAAL